MPRKLPRQFAEPKFYISITGDKALDHALKQFTPVLQKKIQRKVTREIVYHIKAKIEAIAPVDTGAMKANYFVRVASLKLSKPKGRRKTRKNVVGHTAKSGTRSKLGISPTDKYYYPAIVEYGSAKRNIKPNPVMRKTLKNEQNFARYLFRTLMMAQVRETARELRAGNITAKGVKIKK